MKSRITLADVAHEAGISSATVSYVINGNPRIRPETAATVQRVIRQLGYVPGPRGRRRGQRSSRPVVRRTNRIALVVPGLPRSHMVSPVYMDVLHGVEATVRENGKSFLLSHLPCGENCPMELFPQKVDGVILFGATGDERLTRHLRATACVQVMGTIEADGLWDHVSYDNRRLGQIAGDYVVSRGHRQAAFISNGMRRFMAERGEVFAAAMAAAGGHCLACVDDELLNDRGAVQQVVPARMKRVVDRILAAEHRPTAVFLVADILVGSLYGELQRRGLRPGEDLAIVSCNHEQLLLANLQPRPATIDIHAERIGRRAVEQLLWRIEHPGEPRATVALEPALVAVSGE